MAECVLLKKCIFFNEQMANLPATVALMKKNYCLGDNESCARYMVAAKLGRELVPPDLYPSDATRAKEILSNS